MGRSQKELGRGVCRDEGNCHGVRSGAFLGVWPADGEEGCPIPNSPKDSVPALPFLPGGPQRLLVLTDSVGPTSRRHRRAAPWSCTACSLARLSAWLRPIHMSQAPGRRDGRGQRVDTHPRTGYSRTEDTIAGVSCKLLGLQPSFFQVCTTICVMALGAERHVTTKVGMSRRTGLRRGGGPACPSSFSLTVN